MKVEELAVPAANLMGSEVLVGARVCATDGEPCKSDAVSAFPSSKVDECSSLTGERGVSNAAELCFWTEKAGTERFKNNGRLCRFTTEDVSQGLNNGLANNGAALGPHPEGRQIRRKVGKSPRNGSGYFKKSQILQTDNLLHHPVADDTKMESDLIASHLVKCSNADKSQVVKQKNNINGRRGDRRNSKVHQVSVKAGVINFSPANGGSNTFGMYGLKPMVHDISKLVEDTSINLLLDRSYVCPTQGTDKGRKAANVNDNILDSVMKACSILRLRGLQKEKQTEEVDIYDNKKISMICSPSNMNVVNGSAGDENGLVASSSKCNKDQGSCNKAEGPVKMNGSALHQPGDIFERLALPPPKDLDSLLQDALKPAMPVKPADSRCGKPLSHQVCLPAFSWSHNFNGHCKSNNDATKTSNKSICHGRWVRVRSNDSFTGELGTEGYLDLDALTYDDTLVPAGQLKYRLPTVENDSPRPVNQLGYYRDLLSAMGSTSSLLPYEQGSTSDSKMDALHSPTVLAAAQTLCDMANHCMKGHSNGMLKWPKQPSLKTTKARKPRSGEEPKEGLLTPKSEPRLDHSLRSVEHGMSSKKPKLSVVEKRENLSHTRTLIGLCSMSALRSSRPSPNRLSRDPAAESRHCYGSITRPSFVAPGPSRVLDRSSHSPQKLRKVRTIDWNRERS